MLLAGALQLSAAPPLLPPLTTLSDSPRLRGKFVWADLVTDDVLAVRNLYDNDADIIVTPPHPERPDGRPRPVHPIARPPSGIGSSPRPMPSIPSSPRPSGRR